MNIIDKIKLAGKQNGLEFNISGAKRTKIFYGKVLENPYKILSRANGSTDLFRKFCAYLVQNKDCNYIPKIGGYTATFIEGDFKVVIDQNFNGYNIICFYKLK